MHCFSANFRVVESPELGVFSRIMLRTVCDHKTTRDKLAQHRLQCLVSKPMITASTFPIAITAIEEDTKRAYYFAERAFTKAPPPMDLDDLASGTVTIRLGQYTGFKIPIPLTGVWIGSSLHASSRWPVDRLIDEVVVLICSQNWHHAICSFALPKVSHITPKVFQINEPKLIHSWRKQAKRYDQVIAATRIKGISLPLACGESVE
jgi:hypothetical protein